MSLRKVALMVAAAMVACAPPANASSTRCLTPVAEQALQTLFASPEFHTTLGQERRLDGVNLRGDEIEIRLADGGGSVHGITLALSQRGEQTANGRGQRFVYYLAPGSTPADANGRTLLSVAALVDRTIPATAFADCNTPRNAAAPERPTNAPYGEGYPRWLALFSGGLQVLALLAATLFGLRAVRRYR